MMTASESESYKPDIQTVADLPKDFTLTAAMLAPELVAGADTLGTVMISGLGRRVPEKWRLFIGETLGLPLKPQEIAQIEDWPTEKIIPWIDAITTRPDDWMIRRLEELLHIPAVDRWPACRAFLQEKWRETARKHFPKEEQVENPLFADPPPRPDPKVWGHDLITHEPYQAYPALIHKVSQGKGRTADLGWSIIWLESAEEADQRDREARQEAESYCRARKLEAELTAAAQPLDPPVPIPPPYRPQPNQTSEERQEGEATYRRLICDYLRRLQTFPAYHCLSSEVQTKFNEVLEYEWRRPEINPDELCAAWGKATALAELERQGHILTNYGGHFRVMGQTGNADYWVVMPDGALRIAEEKSYRKAYQSEGEKTWRVVGPDELALAWNKNYTAAPHECLVAKLPIAGCTTEQLATVKKLETELTDRFHGTRGISGTVSPDIGSGWNLA